MARCLEIMYNRLMGPFRSVLPESSDPSLRPLVIGHRCPFPMAVETRGLDAWFLFLFEPGARLTLGGRALSVSGPCFVACPPQRPFAHRPLEGGLMRSWLRIQGDGVSNLLLRAGLPVSVPVPLESPEESLSALRGLHQILVHGHAPKRGHVEAALLVWLHTLARDRRDPGSATPDLDPARALLEHAFHEEHSLAALAGLVGLSRAQFCRRFAATYGTSPKQFQRRIRLETAREYLTTTDLPIEEIANRCGFHDRFHLSRIFRKHQGIAPASFRRKARSRRFGKSV